MSHFLKDSWKLLITFVCDVVVHQQLVERVTLLELQLANAKHEAVESESQLANCNLPTTQLVPTSNSPGNTRYVALATPCIVDPVLP